MTRPWEMPAWMQHYRKLIVDADGAHLEQLVNGHANPLYDAPLSGLQISVRAQVRLLEKLHAQGLLK